MSAGFTIVDDFTAFDAAWGHANLRANLIFEVDTTVAEVDAVPGNRFVGMRCREHSTGKLKRWNGSSWDWISGGTDTYSPAVFQGVAVTSTVNIAEFTVNEKWVEVTVSVTASGAGTAGEAIVCGLPIAPAEAVDVVAGVCWINDNGTQIWSGVASITTGDNVIFSKGGGSTGWIGADPSFALASGDVIRFKVTYKR